MNLPNLRLGVLSFMLLFLSVQIDCFPATTAQEEAPECSICIDKLENGNSLRGFIHNSEGTVCHIFHEACLNNWIATRPSPASVKCPNCNRKMWVNREELMAETAHRLGVLRHAFGILPPAEGCIEKLGRCLRRFFL